LLHNDDHGGHVYADLETLTIALHVKVAGAVYDV
jgi:hypothetical protein